MSPASLPLSSSNQWFQEREIFLNLFKSVEIKCQLDVKDDFYCRSYGLLNILRAPLRPSSGALEYYTGGCCLWYLVIWFSSCRYGVELRVVCPVCGLLAAAYWDCRFESRRVHGCLSVVSVM